MKRFLSSLIALAFSATAALALSQSTAPPKFGIPWSASAGVPYINSIPVPSQIGIQNCRASLTDGFPPLTFTPAGAGGCPPFGADWNGILKQITQWSQWQAAGGPVFYDSAFVTANGGYPSGATIMSAIVPGDMWMSTADNNTTNPDAGGAGWVQAPGQIPIGTPVQSLYTTVPTGYVSANGLTIGDASSNGTNRANSDTQLLFSVVWNGCPNAQCPIFTSTGAVSTRGVSAAADYAAHKALAVQNMNGTGLIGADSQNGSTSTNLAGVPVTSGSTTAPGSIVGENLHTLTATQIPSITSTNSGITLTNGSPAVFVTTGTSGLGGNTSIQGSTQGSNAQLTSQQISTAVTVAAQGISISNNTGGQSHNVVERSIVAYWNLKL